MDRVCKEKARVAPGLFGTAVVQDQKPLTLRRPLETTLPLQEAVPVALFMMPALTCAAEAEGLRALNSAAAPATCGVAIEVPL